jgi:hypothetical protein
MAIPVLDRHWLAAARRAEPRHKGLGAPAEGFMPRPAAVKAPPAG